MRWVVGCLCFLMKYIYIIIIIIIIIIGCSVGLTKTRLVGSELCNELKY